MTIPEKIGRATWITYLITAIPIALFCAALSLISLRLLFVEDFGPIEKPPLPKFETAILLFSLIALPIVWALGVTIAHRFNQKIRRTIPFLANILPMSGLLWFSVILARDEGWEFVWMVAYTGILLALLGIGMIAALLSTLQRPQTPNQPCVATGDSACS